LFTGHFIAKVAKRRKRRKSAVKEEREDIFKEKGGKGGKGGAFTSQIADDDHFVKRAGFLIFCGNFLK
jgi:hypothetical protein